MNAETALSAAIYIEHEPRPQAMSWWDTPAGNKVARAIYRLGINVWKAILVCVFLGLMVFALIILVALFSHMAHAETLKGQAPAHITSEFGVALCKKPEDIQRLSQMVGQKDHEAFEKLMIYLIITSRKCTILKPGTSVIVEQIDMDIGAVCVRPRGEPFCGWTTPAAVTPDDPR